MVAHTVLSTVNSTLQERHYQRVFRGPKVAAVWLHWDTSSSGLFCSRFVVDGLDWYLCSRVAVFDFRILPSFKQLLWCSSEWRLSSLFYTFFKPLSLNQYFPENGRLPWNSKPCSFQNTPSNPAAFSTIMHDLKRSSSVSCCPWFLWHSCTKWIPTGCPLYATNFGLIKTKNG